MPDSTFEASTLSGQPVTVELAPDPRDLTTPTVAAFLGTTCFGCRAFWDDLASERSRIAARAKVVIVLADNRLPSSTYRTSGVTRIVTAPGAIASYDAFLQPHFVIANSAAPATWCAGPIETVDDLCVAIEQSVATPTGPGALSRDPSAPLIHRRAITLLDVEGEAVLFDARSGRTHRLNPEAAQVWAALDGSVSPQDIVADFAHRFGTDPVVMRNDVMETAAALERLDAVRGEGEPDATEIGTCRPLVVPPECCGRTTLLRLGDHPKLVIAAGDHHLSVHCNDPKVLAQLSSLMKSRLVPNDVESVNFAIETPSSSNGADAVPALFRGPDVIATASSAGPLILDLVGQLATFATPTPDTMVLDADVWVHHGRASLHIPSSLTAGAAAADGVGTAGASTAGTVASERTDVVDQSGGRAFVAPVLIDISSGELVVEPDQMWCPELLTGTRPVGRFEITGWVANSPRRQGPDRPVGVLDLLRHLGPHLTGSPDSPPEQIASAALALAALGRFAQVGGWLLPAPDRIVP